ncbi:MAG: hypothetical protein LBB53_01610, partial [Prevotellaceae bacterium]|nr:hypothetical protein [Prevotellaceae bacterium]
MKKILIKITKNKYYLFFALLFFNALFFAVFAVLLPIHFDPQGIDDAKFCLIASGAYTGTPDAHLVFINYIYGLILTFFYSHLYGVVEWYMLFFSIIHVVSLTIFCFFILKSKKNKWIKLVYSALLYTFSIIFITSVQFTSLAAFCALAGLVLILSIRKTTQIAGIVWFLLASLIRFDAAMLVLLIMLPLFGYEILKTKQWIKILPFVLIAILALTFRYIDSRQYQNCINHEKAVKFNYYRQRINDNPNFARVQKNLPDEISQNDFVLINDFFVDTKIVTFEKIQKLYKSYQNLPLKYKIKNSLQAMQKKIWLLLFVVLLYFLLFFQNKNWLMRLMLISVIIVLFGSITYVTMQDYLKGRVLLSMMLPIFFISFVASYERTYIHTTMIGIFVVVMFSKALVDNHKYNERLKNDMPYYTQALNHIKEQNLSVVFFFDWFTVLKPFEITKTFENVKIKSIAGYFHYLKLRDDFYIDSHERLLENDINLFIPRGWDKEMASYIQKNLLENYNIDTQIVTKYQNEKYSIFQIKKIVKLPVLT